MKKKVIDTAPTEYYFPQYGVLAPSEEEAIKKSKVIIPRKFNLITK